MESVQTQKKQMEVAQMRFGVIAPLVQGTYTDASMATYCHRVALTPQRLSDGRVFQYKPKTVAKWYQLYEKGDMEALIPRTRCDKGGTWVISDEAKREMVLDSSSRCIFLPIFLISYTPTRNTD